MERPTHTFNIFLKYVFTERAVFKIHHFLRRRRATFDCLRIMNSNNRVNATIGGFEYGKDEWGGEGNAARPLCTFRRSSYVFHHKSKTRRNKHTCTYRMVILTCDAFVVRYKPSRYVQFIPAHDRHTRHDKSFKIYSNTFEWLFSVSNYFQRFKVVSESPIMCVCVSCGRRKRESR